jgi:hypothetical protein
VVEQLLKIRTIDLPVSDLLSSWWLRVLENSTNNDREEAKMDKLSSYLTYGDPYISSVSTLCAKAPNSSPLLYRLTVKASGTWTTFSNAPPKPQAQRILVALGVIWIPALNPESVSLSLGTRMEWPLRAREVAAERPEMPAPIILMLSETGEVKAEDML